MRKKWPWVDIIGAIGVAVLGFGLLRQSEAVSQGIATGLYVCANILIPALFPFMALSGYLSLTKAGEILSLPLAPLTTRVFKLPKEFGAILLLSWISGYPVGAKSIATLLAQKKISTQTAERMLCFCVNAGPSFLISAVGGGLLFSKTAGIILFAAQTLATILIGAAVSFRAKLPKLESGKASLTGVSAFVEAVSGASSAMIAMCSFAILFSGLTALFFSGTFLQSLANTLKIKQALLYTVFSGLLEVTAGCMNAARLGGEVGFICICAICSLCSLSILFQIMTCFRESTVRFRPLLLARIAHAFLAAAIALPLYRLFCTVQPVFVQSPPPILQTNAHTVVLTVCLLCMCAILTHFNPANSRR